MKNPRLFAQPVLMNSTSKPVLKIDWATHEAAKFACVNWHYSKSVPMPPVIRFGVWEGGKFIGVVLFSRGASPHLGAAYGLTNIEVAELTRVALTSHKTPVSRIIAIALRKIKQREPGLRLVVSFADSNQGHHGGIYQGGGWIYAGTTAAKYDYIGPDGKLYRDRQVTASGKAKQFGKMTKVFKISECQAVKLDPKHRYLMPLDAAMREQIAPLAKPYPKRTTRTKEQDAGHPPALDGVTPIRALHIERLA